MEYVCEGCGLTCVNAYLDKPPPSGFCAICQWLSECVPDPEEMMELRRRLEVPDPMPN
jgi:hypothetical protein